MTLRNELAQCTLWPETGVFLNKRRVGAIGEFSVRDDATEIAGREATRDLLDHATNALRNAGSEIAVGPLDGSTWSRYRFVTGGDLASDEPPFILEPENPIEWSHWWEAAGFAPVATYRSAVMNDLTVRDPRASRVRARLVTGAPGGVTIRALDPARAETELKAAYRLSLHAFRGAFLYAPIEETAFLAQYGSVLPRLVPSLVLLAHRRTADNNEELVGFLFALPDLAQARRGAIVDTVILKTIAVPPGRDLAGLGILLADHAHQTAHALGFRRAIHALMHDSNPSRRLSEGYQSRALRRYALYGKGL